ncbi:Piso0_005901 [Millerozyma farinosa CBS 7064]|uniref:Piso0_005901 protein n=1 Tax=Pichia sorbitophila (strain ATCC MYA-4447 / BCRC 22081 / CBS 7064 / NBRC 10061 / NRRL Y-12695) TaxID=559304 RepID=G8Y381_PICSO|nr:Piso0_005901 [Millerozyma farinosa CBS 7064]
MGFWKFAIGTTTVSFAAYFAADSYLRNQIDDITLKQCPSLKLNNILKQPAKGTYFAYTDVFKGEIKNSNVSLDEIRNKFFSQSFITNLPSSFDLQTVSQSKNFWDTKFSEVFSWRWSDKSLLKFFESAASWGYPFRLMNGGYQELYIEKKPDSSGYNVFYANSHEYNDLNDGKVIPQFTQSLHKTYARFILWSFVRSLNNERTDSTSR